MAFVQGDLAGLQHALALVAAVVQWGDAVKLLRVLVLTRYGVLGASSRLRFSQYFSALHGAGMQIQCLPLFGDEALGARYRRGQYSLGAALTAFGKRMQVMFSHRDFDVVWIEKEALPWCPLWLELALLSSVPYVLDYDDAVFHNYDLHSSALVRRLYGQRLDGLMARAALVVCGNAYLAQRATDAGAVWVERLPTVIDLDRYTLQGRTQTVAEVAEQVPRIVWIGSPSTAKYLALLSQPLQALAQRMPFVLRVIGAEFALPGVQVECVPWADATEVADIAACDVGVMPLQDSAWERGKCGYKLIQYMACGLPVVASDVGMNEEIVKAGGSGYLARSDDEWLEALMALLSDAALCQKFGLAGRQRVEDVYCIQKTGPVMSQWLAEAAGKS